MTTVRVLAEVAGVRMDAIRTETALRHALGWCRDHATATIGFLDSHQLRLLAHRYPYTGTAHTSEPHGSAQPPIDLLLPADSGLAAALRRHGGLLAQATDPPAFSAALLDALAQKSVSQPPAIGIIAPGIPVAEALAARVRRLRPELPVPLVYALPHAKQSPSPKQSPTFKQSLSLKAHDSHCDPWSPNQPPPKPLLEDCREYRLTLTLLIGPGLRCPLQSALTLAHATGQVVLALPGTAIPRLLPRPDRPPNLPTPKQPHWLARTQAQLWTRYFA